MSRLITIISILSLAVAATAGTQSASDGDLMKKGMRLYQKKQFDAALDTYMEALAVRGNSGPLLYNIGNVYFRRGEIGEAIRYYEKAARRIPEDPKVQHNLKVARQHIDRPIPSIPAPFWQRWWHQLVNVLGSRGLFLVGLGAYLPAAVLIGCRIWRNTLPRLLNLTTYFLLVVAAAGLGSGLLTSWQKTLHQQAVVTAPDTNLYSEPAANSTVDRTVPEGTVVYINETSSGWQNVQLPNGATGWVARTDVGDI